MLAREKAGGEAREPPRAAPAALTTDRGIGGTSAGQFIAHHDAPVALATRTEAVSLLRTAVSSSRGARLGAHGTPTCLRLGVLQLRRTPRVASCCSCFPLAEMTSPLALKRPSGAAARTIHTPPLRRHRLVLVVLVVVVVVLVVVGRADLGLLLLLLFLAPAKELTIISTSRIDTKEVS